MTTKRKPNILTTRELQIMQVIWPVKFATVREVYDTLRAPRTIAYTTVQTMMNILTTKGFLRKERAQRPQRYRAIQEEEQVIRTMILEFVDRVFDGSPRLLLQHLIDEHQTSQWLDATPKSLSRIGLTRGRRRTARR